jgi:hypothetical protein
MIVYPGKQHVNAAENVTPAHRRVEVARHKLLMDYYSSLCLLFLDLPNK